MSIAAPAHTCLRGSNPRREALLCPRAVSPCVYGVHVCMCACVHVCTHACVPRWAFALSSGVCIDCVGITSTPVVGPSGTVYVGGYDGALYALQTGPA